MERIAPLMGARRRDQIGRAIAGYDTKRRRLRQSERDAIIAGFRSGRRAVELADEFRVRREHVYRLVRGR